MAVRKEEEEAEDAAEEAVITREAAEVFKDDNDANNLFNDYYTYEYSQFRNSSVRRKAKKNKHDSIKLWIEKNKRIMSQNL